MNTGEVWLTSFDLKLAPLARNTPKLKRRWAEF